MMAKNQLNNENHKTTNVIVTVRRTVNFAFINQLRTHLRVNDSLNEINYSVESFYARFIFSIRESQWFIQHFPLFHDWNEIPFASRSLRTPVEMGIIYFVLFYMLYDMVNSFIAISHTYLSSNLYCALSTVNIFWYNVLKNESIASAKSTFPRM